ncbi:MAG: hypothetical protein NE330_17210 [Lentisphaeraceae bacterium]|nr:hypothetical protein [Lentisphaeraceae bacterium]
MKYIVALLIFGITGKVLWSAGNYIAEIEALKLKKIEIENIKIYKNGDGLKSLRINQTKALKPQTNKTSDSLHKEDNPKNSREATKELQEVFDAQDQEPKIIQSEVNIILKDYRGYEAELIQEINFTPKKQIADYKKRVLSRLFSSNTINTLTQPATTTKTTVNDQTTDGDQTANGDQTADKQLSTTEFIEQVPSSTSIEVPYEDFNFSKQEKLDLQLTTETTNGKILPNTRLTIENSQGQILLEGSTNLEGSFQKELTVFTGEKLYVRYYGVGISQEKNEITRKGEE